MYGSAVPTLDYAASPSRRRRDPARWPPISLLVGALLCAAFLASAGGKVVPGGPFVSLHADVAPVLISLGLVGAAWRSLRHGPAWRRVSVAVLVLLAVAVLV